MSFSENWKHNSSKKGKVYASSLTLTLIRILVPKSADNCTNKQHLSALTTREEPLILPRRITSRFLRERGFTSTRSITNHENPNMAQGNCEHTRLWNTR